MCKCLSKNGFGIILFLNTLKLSIIIIYYCNTEQTPQCNYDKSSGKFESDYLYIATLNLQNWYMSLYRGAPSPLIQGILNNCLHFSLMTLGFKLSYIKRIMQDPSNYCMPGIIGWFYSKSGQYLFLMSRARLKHQSLSKKVILSHLVIEGF